MNKSDLVDALASSAGMTKADAARAMDALFAPSGGVISSALKEGKRVLDQAAARWPIKHALVVHREGLLALGDVAVWVGVSSPHRDEAFSACRWIIDEVKVRLPIWKKETWTDGDSGWVNCERCAAHAPSGHSIEQKQ